MPPVFQPSRRHDRRSALRGAGDTHSCSYGAPACVASASPRAHVSLACARLGPFLPLLKCSDAGTTHLRARHRQLRQTHGIFEFHPPPPASEPIMINPSCRSPTPSLTDLQSAKGRADMLLVYCTPARNFPDQPKMALPRSGGFEESNLRATLCIRSRLRRLPRARACRRASASNS